MSQKNCFKNQLFLVWQFCIVFHGDVKYLLVLFKSNYCVLISVVTIHRCIDESRYLSRHMYCDTVCNNRDTRDLATFLRFLFECLTDINCQSAKNYQCRMSSHPQQTAGSYSQLKVSNYVACPSSATNGVMTNVLSVVTGSSSLDSSRRRVSTLVIVFFACDFRGPGKT